MEDAFTGSEGNVYSLNFLRLFPEFTDFPDFPDLVDTLPVHVFYQIYLTNFYNKYSLSIPYSSHIVESTIVSP